jgi:uncharacterized protein YigA (DUF484 family)
MARALLGHVGLPNEQLLAFEVARLRRRVAELEAELAEARRHATEFDMTSIELHQLAEDAQPALA